jgi:hypothetical protein
VRAIYLRDKFSFLMNDSDNGTYADKWLRFSNAFATVHTITGIMGQRLVGDRANDLLQIV